MGFIAEKGKDFIWKKDHFELTKEFFDKHCLEFTKLTGSKFAGVLGESDYNTPLKEWCEMVGIYEGDFDPIYTRTGNKYEPFIRAEAEKKLGYKFIFYNSHDEGGNVFRDEYPFIGGIPDGEPIDENGEIDYSNGKRMIEIKTAGIDSFKSAPNKDGKMRVVPDENKMPVVKTGGEGLGRKKWYPNGALQIPLYYLDQLNLYLYLRKQTKGIFAVLFLKPEDYINLDKIDLSNKEILYKEVELDRVSFDIKVNQAIKWYKDYVVKGISPKYTFKDIRWLKEEGIL